MAYVKNIWVDQDVERPKTYEVTNNQDGSITLTDSFGLVTELGTPVNETNMNHIEDGIDGCAIRKHNLTETFNLGEWVLGGTGDDEGIYKSLIANNVGNAISDDTKWEKVEMGGGSSRNIGEIVASTIPLIDAGLHLLDGALLQYGSYQAFIDYIADLYDSGDYTAIFETEANWQASVTLTGVCDKFVYDSVNNTVRLPKYGNQIWSGGGNAPVIGNGTSLGFTTGSINSGVVYSGSGSNLFCGYTGVYGEPVGTNYTGSTTVGANKSIGLTTDSTKSGIITDLANITTSLDGYYYIVVATSTKTQIQVDIDEIATDLNGKMDTDGTNAVSSVKFADGQWVQSSHILGTSTAINSYSCDVSSFLPADSYNYEVMINVYLYCNNSNTNSRLRLSSDIWAELNNDATSAQALAGGYGRNSNNTFIIPVGVGRTITYRIFNTAADTAIVEMWGYRRIGTNQ